MLWGQKSYCSVLKTLVFLSSAVQYTFLVITFLPSFLSLVLCPWLWLFPLGSWGLVAPGSTLTVASSGVMGTQSVFHLSDRRGLAVGCQSLEKAIGGSLFWSFLRDAHLPVLLVWSTLISPELSSETNEPEWLLGLYYALWGWSLCSSLVQGEPGWQLLSPLRFWFGRII